MKNTFKSECTFKVAFKGEEQKLSILVIFTGGTIGSTVSDGYISTDASKTYKLLELYKPRNHHHVTFDIVEPYTLLSENLTGEHLAK